jgi:hypothetical protein
MALDVPEYIRAKIRAGLLPVAPNGTIRVLSRIGSGYPCHGCDRSITPGQFECETEVRPGRPLLFHRACFDVWKLVRMWD